MLTRVRSDGDDVDAEIREMTDLAEREQRARTRGWSGLRADWVRPALIVGCGVAIFTQLSGIEMIVYYSPTILTDAGFPDETALQVSVALGLSYLVAQLVGLTIIDRVGRRRLTLIMIPGAALSLVALGLLFVTGHSQRGDIPFIVTCLVVFMLFNAGGLQLMGWLTGSEIYPLAVRSVGTAVQSAALWSSNLLITLTLLTIINGIGVGPDDVALRRVQRGGLDLRVAAHARPDRTQPRGDRGQARRRPVPPRRLRPLTRQRASRYSESTNPRPPRPRPDDPRPRS